MAIANKHARSRRQSVAGVQLPGIAAHAAVPSRRVTVGKRGSRSGARSAAHPMRLSSADAVALLRKAEVLARWAVLSLCRPHASHAWVQRMLLNAAH